MFIIDTDALQPEEVITKVEDIIFNLTGYTFKKQVKLPASTQQMSLNKFLK